MCPQFLDDTLRVVPRRTHADRHRIGDLRQCKPARQVSEQFALATCDVVADPASAATQFRSEVGATMTRQLQTLAPSTDLAELRSTLDRGLVAIVADSEHFYGLITRFDLLNHLRRKLS